MGNICSLFAPPKPVKKRRPITKRQSSVARSSSSRRDKFEDAVIQEHAFAAAAILFRQQNADTGSLRFDRSASQRYSVSGSKKNQLPRSSSSRSRSSTDPLLKPHQFLNQVPAFIDLSQNFDPAKTTSN